MSSKAAPAVEQTMSFFEHLDELRRRLTYSAIAIAVAFVVCLIFADKIYAFLEKPVHEALQKQRQFQIANNQVPMRAITELPDNTPFTYVFNNEANLQGVTIPAGTTMPARLEKMKDGRAIVAAAPIVVGKVLIPEGFHLPVEAIANFESSNDSDHLVVHTLQSGFNLYIKVAFYAGLCLSVPFLILQLWFFISPGLYEHEKKSVFPFVSMGTGFFLLGAVFAYYIAFPRAVGYFLTVSQNFRPMIEVNEYFDLIFTIILGLGLVFEIPTIVYFLARFGLITPRFMLRFWRHATVIIFIIAAVVSPTTDIPNLLVFALPMEALYFLSVGIAWAFGKPRRKEAAA